jgi:hypothetical protein
MVWKESRRTPNGKSRCLKTDIPQPEKTFVPEWHYLPSFRVKDKEYKAQQKVEYDRRHRAKPLPPLLDDESVWVHTQNRQTPGRVVQQAATPRSYIVETPSGNVRRTQSHLSPRPNEEQGIAAHTEPTGNQQIPYYCHSFTNWNAYWTTLQTNVLEEGRCGILT